MKNCITCGALMPEWPATDDECDQCLVEELDRAEYRGFQITGPEEVVAEPVRAVDGRCCECEDAPCCGCYDE